MSIEHIREAWRPVFTAPASDDAQSVALLLLWVQDRPDYYPGGRRLLSCIAATEGWPEDRALQAVRELEEAGAPLVLQCGIVTVAQGEV